MIRLSIDCSAELARYEDVEDELFLQYYEVDPIQVLQRAFERSLAECKDEVCRFSPSSTDQILTEDIAGSDWIFDCFAGRPATRRTTRSEHGRLLLLVSLPLSPSPRSCMLTRRCDRIIRGSDYIFRSEEQQHAFNYPVQVGTNSRDTPIKDAQRFNIKVQKDDVGVSLLCSLCDS